MLSSVHVPESDAFVAWYGFPPLDYVDAAKIKAPVQGHWAIDDAFFKIDQVDLLEEKLKKAGVSYEFHRYEARHAFANETAINLPIPAQYDPAASALAWSRTMEFLKRNLV